MKKLLAIFVILAAAPVFASCPIDSEGAACSIAQFQKPMQQTFSKESNISEFSETPEVRLKPAQNNADKNYRNFGSQPTDYSYNSNCQFGVCSNTGTPQLFQMRNTNQ